MLLNESNYILRPNITSEKTAGQLYTFQQMNFVTLLTLNIAQPTRGIGGIYSCKATNRFGSQERQFSLKIEGNQVIISCATGFQLRGEAAPLELFLPPLESYNTSIVLNILTP